MNKNNNISQEQLETIERYLNNAMTTDERNTFETHLESNFELQQQLEEVRILSEGINKAVFEEKLEVFHDDLTKKKSSYDSSSKLIKLDFKTLSIAATFLILIGSVWFFNQQPEHSKLFDQYFEPDRGLATVMGESDNYDFDDAMVDYKNTKYELAIQKWEVLLAAKPESDTLNYFLGVAHLANKNENKSIDYLGKVIEDPKSKFINDAYYYLGLAYLKADNTEAAIVNLKKNNFPKGNEIISELSD